MRVMRRWLRTLAAVVAGLALVAALPAPCGCAPQGPPSKHADEHACCVPPTGVRAVGHGCCDGTPVAAPAVSSPVGPDAVTPVAPVLLAAATPFAHRLVPRAAVRPACSPPPAILRI